jgi:hypothetical protein
MGEKGARVLCSSRVPNGIGVLPRQGLTGGGMVLHPSYGIPPPP